MSTKRKQGSAFRLLAIGILAAVVAPGCANHVNKPARANSQHVVVHTEQEGDETRVTCTLPQRTIDGALYEVQTITVNDSRKNPLPAEHTFRTPTVSFVAPDDEIAGITLDAIYIDARAFKETTKDLDKRVDWPVRFQQFPLRELLKPGGVREE